MVELERFIKIYDYHKAVADDVRDLVKEREQNKSFRLSWYIHEKDGKHYFNRQEAADDLGNVAFNNDSVTGNASGSYTLNTLVAERCLVGNRDLLCEALADFGDEQADILTHGAEWCDVTIRCYLVDETVDEIMTEYQTKHHLADLPLDDYGQDIDPDSLPM